MTRLTEARQAEVRRVLPASAYGLGLQYLVDRELILASTRRLDSSRLVLTDVKTRGYPWLSYWMSESRTKSETRTSY